MITVLGGNRFEGDFGMPMLPGAPLDYTDGDYVRLAALELMAREVAARGTPGAAAEVGVYRGGFARHLSALLPDRPLYLFDTFTGFDAGDLAAGLRRGFAETPRDWSGTGIPAVRDALPHPENAVFVRGRFPDTAAGLEEHFCLVSLDADLYLPTAEGLRYFWPRLSPGGFILVHDYNNVEYPGAAGAVREFAGRTGAAYVPLPDICGSAVFAKQFPPR